MNEIKLGNKVRCKVTGFEGIVTADITYLNGCRQLCVKPKMDKKSGKMPNGQYIDVGQLEYVSEGVIVHASDTGGPQMDTPKG